MNQPQTGDRISNYLLDYKVGQGSFGEVWRAHHHIFGDAVAIKIPSDLQYTRYLQRDGVVIHGLHHPNIVRALDMDPYGNPPYLVMEFIDGPSLREVIAKHPGGMPTVAVLNVMAGLLLALEAAHHDGVIHRDVKPGNILIESFESTNDSVNGSTSGSVNDSMSGSADEHNGNGQSGNECSCDIGHVSDIDVNRLSPDRVKVADFGLGSCVNGSSRLMMQSGSIQLDDGQRISGTLAYMSPEQREGKTVDHRSDLYSAGVVLHEMLTGRLPQGSDSPSHFRPELPQWLDEFFHRCYTHQDRRFESAQQMQQIIRRHLPVNGCSETHGIATWAGTCVATRTHRNVQLVGEQLVCRRCRSNVEEQDQFCIHCGQQLVEVVPRCPSCYGFVGRKDRYCLLCGGELPSSAT